MSACHVTGCAQGGIKVLSCAVSDALSQGDACDQLRQVEPLETLVLQCKPSSSLVEGCRDDEVEALQAFIEAPWMLLQAVLGIASHDALKVTLELPQPHRFDEVGGRVLVLLAGISKFGVRLHPNKGRAALYC